MRRIPVKEDGVFRNPISWPTQSAAAKVCEVSSACQWRGEAHKRLWRMAEDRGKKWAQWDNISRVQITIDLGWTDRTRSTDRSHGAHVPHRCYLERTAVLTYIRLAFRPCLQILQQIKRDSGFVVVVVRLRLVDPWMNLRARTGFNHTRSKTSHFSVFGFLSSSISFPLMTHARGF